MKVFIKRILELILPDNVMNYFRNYYVISFQKTLYREWNKNGCPVPPPHLVKQKIITEFQERYNYEVLVETGTYKGDMVEAQKKIFNKVFSIELGDDLYRKAKKRFKNDRNVEILQGDSGKVLPELIKSINKPAIFWLDGHYSGGETAKGNTDCPIFQELDAIFRGHNLNHILLIDDARLFNGEGDYPTVEKLTNFVKNHNENYQLDVKHDIIRYVIENKN